MKRKYAIGLFILILTLAKLSEPELKTEPKPEEKLIWVEEGRIYAEEGFMDLTREERETMLKNISNNLHN